MATVKTSSDIAEQLRALVPDLPRYCQRIVITLAVDELPEVVATFFPAVGGLDSAAQEFKAITQRYQLIPVGEAAPEAPAAPNAADVDRDQIAAAMKATHDAAVKTIARRLHAAGLNI